MSRQYPDEISLLKKIAQAAGPRAEKELRILARGIGDDAALFKPRPGHETILTCDWFLEGTHFLRDMHPPDAVGWKCLARAVSDVAAMGGMPRCFLLSLALPKSHTGPWLDLFLRGLRHASRKLQCVLAGGDTTRRQEILINVTVAGEVCSGHAVLRSGARAGDVLYVSGRLGEAELGLQLLRQCKGVVSEKNPLIRKHLYPEPRVALGEWLAKRGLATAMMDLSDGLSSELPRLCAASGVGARVEGAKIPLVKKPAVHGKQALDLLQLALHGGDDYELLFTAPRRFMNRIPRRFRGIPLTAIGEITRGQRPVMIRADGREQPLIPGGWDPFRG